MKPSQLVDENILKFSMTEKRTHVSRIRTNVCKENPISSRTSQILGHERYDQYLLLADLNFIEFY